MNTSNCSFDFPPVSRKTVTADFGGGDITSNAGVLLAAAADRKIGLVDAMAAAADDKRQRAKTSYDLATLMKERICAPTLDMATTGSCACATSFRSNIFWDCEATPGCMPWRKLSKWTFA